MSNDTITFSCPACHIRLTVPGTLAGVVGPCPNCRNSIQAPHPSPPTAPAYQPVAPVSPVSPSQGVQPPPAASYPSSVAPVYQPPAYQPPQQPQPVYQPNPYPTAPLYQAPAGHEAVAPAPVYQPQPLPAEAPAPAQPPTAYEPPPLPAPPPVPTYQQPMASEPAPVAAEPVSPAVLRPEPRQLPNRSSHGEPLAKQMPDPVPGGSSALKPNPLPRHPHRRSRFIRALVPLMFVAAAVGLGYGVASFLKNQPQESTLPTPAAPAAVNPPAVPSTPLETPQPPVVTPPTLPVPAPEQPPIVEPPPELPDGIEPVSPSSEARVVLDKFLTAKTLAERLPIIETRTPETELEKSCLAGPLPPAPADKIFIETMENNAMEQVTDFYHAVDFTDDGNRVQAHIVLVRIRGGGTPKVVVDPFLDSYGGRLAAFTKTPHDKAGEFQVVVSALASCYNENVPNREKKLTLKLLPRDNEKAMTEAYFGRQSDIARMLEDGNYLLSYGKAKACTVLLRWNGEENSEKPFLEALKIKTPDWNP
jgi:hypothetical protein